MLGLVNRVGNLWMFTLSMVHSCENPWLSFFTIELILTRTKLSCNINKIVNKYWLLHILWWDRYTSPNTNQNECSSWNYEWFLQRRFDACSFLSLNCHFDTLIPVVTEPTCDSCTLDCCPKIPMGSGASDYSIFEHVSRSPPAETPQVDDLSRSDYFFFVTTLLMSHLDIRHQYHVYILVGFTICDKTPWCR